jgi:RND family efflux transporter MFP subunit
VGTTSTTTAAAVMLAALTTLPQAAVAQTATSRSEFAALAGAFNCTITPLRIVELSASMEGVIKSVVTSPGEVVSEGDVIAFLDDTVALQDLRLAELRATSTAMLDGAKSRQTGLQARVARLERAFQRKAVSASDIEAAQLELSGATADVLQEEDRLALAKAELGRAQAYMDRLVLRSPVSGVIGEDLIDPGESVAKQHVATIYVNQPLRVEAFVPAAQIAAVIADPAPQIIVNGNTDAPVAVSFDYAAPVADLASNTISVFYKLDAPDVLPGSKCVIRKNSS